MSFSLSNINGIQMQKDSVLSSLSVACDAITVLPKNNLLYKEPRDGKAALSVDVCNLEVANLEVNGTRSVKVNLPAFVNDTGAVAGGLVSGQLYQTDGAGVAPLNAPGIVMVVQ
jgi:hypothetical protein